jgi:hypothetical protein
MTKYLGQFPNPSPFLTKPYSIVPEFSIPDEPKPNKLHLKSSAGVLLLGALCLFVSGLADPEHA